MLPAPLIDTRTSDDVVRQLLKLLRSYSGDESQLQQGMFSLEQGASRALVEIFGRFAELIIERLNQVPNKNLLAFLDLIGASLLPPQPARVPLTFSLANGSTVDGVVPARTQVAAVSGEGETAPVVYETDAELVVTAAQLVSLFMRRPDRGSYADNSTLINSIAARDVPLFKGAQPVEHIVYLAHDTLFSDPDLNTLTLVLEVKPNAKLTLLRVMWETWNGSSWFPFRSENITDGTSGLSKSGEVTLKSLSPFLRNDVNGMDKCWLRCRLISPIPNIDGQADKLPELKQVQIKAATSRGTGLQVDHAITNDTKVDVVKGFFPFGERPKVGDTLYLAQQGAFKKTGATITLHIKIGNAATGDALSLAYEFWDGNSWYPLTKNDDKASNLTTSGDITLTFPKQPVPTTINGIESFWIRIRITGGSYGKEAHFVLVNDTDPSKGYKLVPGTLAPPLISSLTVDYSVTQPLIVSPPIVVTPEVVLTYNDFEYQNVTLLGSFKPFQCVRDVNPTVYLGFTLPTGLTSFPNRKLSLYAALAEFKQGEKPNPVTKQPEVVWEYWNGGTWSNLIVRDYSENLSKPGLIEFLAPPDFQEHREFGSQCYWLRAIWKSGEYRFEPRLRGVLLNATMATQAVTIEDEVLGSSNQTANQLFHTIRAPVLAGPQLYIREPELPPANERVDSSVATLTNVTDGPKEIWVRWDQTPDFYGSGPRDRHYILDNLTGEVRFGDGQNGLIPPAGNGNVRMSVYRTGGGIIGNKPAGVITQLKTTVPYVRKVVNHLPAIGGSEGETTDSLRRRAPRSLRHGDRAVTVKDYEDLALLASTEVARAKCLPLINVIIDDPAGKTSKIRNGIVSLIIVPQSTEAKSAPTMELIGRVQEFIGRRQSPFAELIVTGPKYLGINVEVDVAPVSFDGAGEIKLSIARTISSYLHPLTGGMDGVGWDFGRYPHESNLYALIEALPGVDHVRSLKFTPAQDSDEVSKAGAYFLVYSGTHTINLKS